MAARRLSRPLTLHRSDRTAVGALVAVLLGLLCLTPGAARAAQQITVGGTGLDRPLPRDFLSLSVTMEMIQESVGPADEPVDPVLVQLIHNLDPVGAPILRVGGQGADRAWWPIAGMHQPIGVSESLSRTFTAAARRLAQALPARYLLQINLEAGSLHLAQVEADQLVAGIGRSSIAALEIGNEPDLYSSIPWGWTVHGRPLPWYADRGTAVYARPSDYDAADFIAEFQRFAGVLPRGLPLAGPDLVTSAWLPAFAGLMTPRSRLRFLDAHAYPLIKCVKNPDSPEYPTVSNLLAPRASRDLLSGDGPYIGQARRDGGQFLLDELGAVSCGGKAGVSNTMASALWVMDALFALDQAGVSGVDLHDLARTVGSLFDVSQSDGHWHATIHPIYLGAAMFAQAAPAGSRLLALSGVDPSRLRAWATIAPDGELHVLLINPYGRTSASLAVPAAYGAAMASVQRLTAPSVAATGGLRFDGQPFSQTATGSLPTGHLASVTARGGRFTVGLPAGSAALLTFAR